MQDEAEERLLSFGNFPPSTTTTSNTATIVKTNDDNLDHHDYVISYPRNNPIHQKHRHGATPPHSSASTSNSTSWGWMKRSTSYFKCGGQPESGRFVLRIAIIIMLFTFLCDLGTCDASSYHDDHRTNHDGHSGVWSHFVQNASNTQEWESFETEGVLPKAAQQLSGRRSRKIEFEFPDGDSLILGDGGQEYDHLRVLRSGPCTCWNTTSDMVGMEVECKCSEENFTQLYSTIRLPLDLHRLTVEHAKDFTTLGNADLRPYAATLSELVLSELPQFKEMQVGALVGMRNLNTIYIHEAHSLKEISADVFSVFLPKLKIIRMTHTGLETAPNLGKLHVNAALHMVEFENGKISQLVPGGFKDLRTEHLSLSYNNLREISPLAFNGSTIARLGLNGNRQLTKLHPDSFVGIQHLRVLDLSETSITYLPTQGLKNIEILKLENVWTLIVIPSIYHFQSLEQAVLTWPYHCCAFANPETHDPATYQAEQERVRTTVQEHCAKASGTTTSTLPTSVSDPSISSAEGEGGKNHNNKIGFNHNNNRFPRSLDEPNTQFPLKLSSNNGESSRTKWMRKRESGERTAKPVNSGPAAAINSIPFHSTSSRESRGMTLQQPDDDHNALRRRRSGSGGSSSSSRYSRATKKGQQQDHDGPHHDDQDSEHFKEHLDSFDPYAWDPERSFGEVLGTKTDTDADFNDEHGVFHHHSVDPSPTVITLCGNVTMRKVPKVSCRPIPDAFNPCEDIMGSFWLRGAVWIVVALSLIGNTAVLVVLLLAPGRMSVQRFLMANLSWADLCMGLYLLMVATEDLVSLGSYFNYAIDWQLGWGCQIAGFLTVFASELSVFTLAVITGERWYALTRAIHLTKRLTIVGAAQLMSVGWILSMILAGLPLVGVSSYSKTSICLPMEANSVGSITYLCFMLVFNGVAFLLVATAYWQMYRAVAGHGAASAPGASSADTAIAKKMALLVFTDFACWAPVAFFGLTAVGGFPLIGVTDSKILLVFFYPLNSTLNPYLYAIMTKQYRRDLLLLLSRHGICTRRAAKYKAGGVSTNNTLQTMQTVLRLGSLTETKVLNPHSPSPHHNHNNSPNGGAGHRGFESKMPIPQQNLLEVDPPPYQKTNPNLDEMSSSFAHIFEHPLLPKNGVNSIANAGDDHRNDPHNIFSSDDEDNNPNSVNGRLLAETSFISVPTTPTSTTRSALGGGNGHSPTSCLKKGSTTTNNSSASTPGRHVKLVSQGRDYNLEDDHEISEDTPLTLS